MKETFIYSAMALALVVSIGVFYTVTDMNTNKSSCLAGNSLLEKDSKKLEKNNKYEISTNQSDKNISKSLVKTNDNRDNKMKNGKHLVSKNEISKDRDEVQMPKEFNDMKEELEVIKQEEAALLEQTNALVDSIDMEDEKLKEESEKAEEILMELQDKRVVDVELIKQKVEELTKPIAIEDTPQEVKSILQDADKARMKMEKKLIELEIIEKRGEKVNE